MMPNMSKHTWKVTFPMEVLWWLSTFELANQEGCFSNAIGKWFFDSTWEFINFSYFWFAKLFMVDKEGSKRYKDNYNNH